jgi:hypothetical protein
MSRRAEEAALSEAIADNLPNIPGEVRSLHFAHQLTSTGSRAQMDHCSNSHGNIQANRKKRYIDPIASSQHHD